MPDDTLERLQIDAGRRTIGELMQERAAAVHEIRAFHCSAVWEICGTQLDIVEHRRAFNSNGRPRRVN